ncbi:hypothetical protein CK222_21665 [Mesorhizobium sp. WSM3866]|uniref:hypothetical protein n=1 Tax=Mesorhizobium sp. WSM3866 TaxID=422271 RepID=UPI000BAF7FE9|nr:hypothetical protein [Mesorhizobium sp. WSM3866]PBB41766.1 hypothetical protein CK222_21665 [Mesorhizobium sp. WSM3866]
MARIKITPKPLLDFATTVMADNGKPEPAYHQANGWVCKVWFDERNAIANHIMREGIFLP